MAIDTASVGPLLTKSIYFADTLFVTDTADSDLFSLMSLMIKLQTMLEDNNIISR